MIDKPYNSGTWTEARMHSFIKSALRAASNRWGPKYEVQKAARIERGIYLCAGYKRKAHSVPASLPPKPGNKRRRKVTVDHINPIIDPACGFQTWDELISNLFCEADGLQLLCSDCHTAKTKDERSIHVARRQSNVR